MNMQSLLKQAKKMQNEMGKAEKEFESKVFEEQMGGGVVKVAMKGDFSIQSIEIAPELLSADNKEDLEDLLTSTMNTILNKISSEKDEMMKELTGGVSMPGMF